MAAQGYIIVAPNRRGVPSFGQEWVDQISGDYSGQNIRDYLSAIDDVAKETWCDNTRLGCVGASYGGYSVFFLAGNHDKRFKAFIAHCGIFNFESMYGHTEELWFVNNDYGGMPIQIGYCNGHSTKLNALEYHRDSELNITYDDVILLLAKQSELNTADWSIDAARTRAFFLPAGMAVELYASTLHYAPSSADDTGFQVIIVLPKGTNLAKPAITAKNGEDRLLTAANKWLIAHAEAKAEVAGGAHVGIRGGNPDARSVWK